ncbi:DNA-binding protein WhiA [Aerococcus viridans]|uniref:DNA-binding protein WhiA n=1 Tax=Aerococcus viridans TaxID=1377 RepID=UPI003AA8E357
MASFAGDVKKELTQLTVDYEHARSELAAILRMNGSISLMNGQLILNVQTENAAIARRIYSLLKEFFHTYGELVVRKKMKLKKNNIYIVRVKDRVEEILKDLEILDTLVINPNISAEMMENEQRSRSYLRGAFLAGGSVNNPEKSAYHLEIYSVYEEHCEDLVTMMNQFNLNARSVERRSGYIAYLKGSEQIADFLALIGATSSMLKFEDIRIVRDMRNSVNRIVNCENANLNKTVTAASKQVENIELIQATVGIGELPEKLQEIALLRLENPEASIKELGELVDGEPISKSGVNHRLRKINQYAEQLRNTAITQ